MTNQNAAWWKCRAVENEENQVSLRSPPPLEIVSRFPHSHRTDGESPSPRNDPKDFRKESRLPHTPSGPFLD